MLEKLPDRLLRLLLTLLLSLGLTLALTGLLELDLTVADCLWPCVLTALALEAATASRRFLVPGLAALALLGCTLFFGGGGAAALPDLFRALSLQVSGIPGALPLVSREACVFFSVTVTALSFCCTRRGASFAWSLMLTLSILLILWMSDRTDLTAYLIAPAVVTLAMLMISDHEEVSLFRVVPWAACIVLLAVGLTPRDGLVVPALKERADSLRQAVMDRMFFTDPRDVFSLSTEGYYPQGISQLGGPANPSDQPALQVSAGRTAYLRGVVMNEYDGHTWRNTLGGRRYLWSSSAMGSTRSVLFDMNLPSEDLASSLTDTFPVSVRMLRDGASTLFVPQRVRSLSPGGDLVPYFTNSSEIFVTRNLKAGDTWTVQAPLFLAGDPGLGTLVNAAEATEDSQWQSISGIYTALPAHLEAPVWQMAAEITEGLSAPYDKAFAIQNYLSRNYRYTLDAAPQPANVDFVTNFLFGTKEGYCTYFASAMTVLCRMAGLPARYVEGYLAEPDENGQALVTGLNAHAWTEVYFRGFGWLTFDATPRRGSGTEEGGNSGPDSADPTPTPKPEATPTPVPPAGTEVTPTPEPVSAPTPTPQPEDVSESPTPEELPPAETDSPLPEPTDSGSPGFPWALLVALLLCAVCGLSALRWRMTSPIWRERKAASEADRFDLWMDDTLARLAAAGYVRAPGETLMGFTRRLDAEADLPVPLGPLGECASLLHYGRVTALDTDTVLARDASQKLKTSLPRRARLRYAFRRFFGEKRGRRRK